MNEVVDKCVAAIIKIKSACGINVLPPVAAEIR